MVTKMYLCIFDCFRFPLLQRSLRLLALVIHALITNV